MIPRERAAIGEAEAVPGPAGARHAPTNPRPDAGPLRSRFPVWEDLYRAISSEQQRELLALAGRQGVLYAHQLPVPLNGTTADPNRQLLARILSGEVAELSSLHPEPIEVGDRELDTVQRDAVAKALATPDLFLIQGQPGSGKSRVVAEIIARAAARGERVLLLAPTVAAIDRVLEGLSSREVVFPVRCLDRDENVSALAQKIRALTFPERVHSLTVHARESARRQAEVEEQRLQLLRSEEPLFVQLEELACRWTPLENDCQALQKRRSELSAEVAEQGDAAESTTVGTFALRMQDSSRAHEEARAHYQTRLAELNDRIQVGEQNQTVLDAELGTLRPLVEAKQQRRWWTAAWWRATLQGKRIRTRWTQQQERRQQIEADLDSVREQAAALTQQWEEAERVVAAKRADLIAAEVARRQAELEDREADLRREQSVLQQKWQAVCQSLSPHSPRPAAMTPQAVRAARSAWRRQVEQAESQHAFARQWLAHLEQTPQVLTGRLPSYVNLVAATITALSRDEHFGESALGSAARPDFDLLVLEEADQITEPEFLQAARRAQRWVLIGEAAWPEENAASQARHKTTTRDPKSVSASHRSRAAAPPRSGVFQRLWQHLHCDPRQLPYSWILDQNRLCCRMRPLTPEQRQWIATEHVADFPDIELRILTVPGSQPALAEIVFPPSFTIDRAKEYIFQELEELAVQASGSSLRWMDEGDRLVLRLADRDLAHGPAIPLVSGIREILGSTATETNGSRDPAAGWQTCCLEFDRAAGWDRARAAEWVQRHLGLRDLGRTARLDLCYRMATGLSAFVSDFLATSGSPDKAPSPFFTIRGAEHNGRSAVVEFVPVPPLREGAATPAHGRAGAEQRGMAASSSGSRLPALPRKGGTGLEVDLADPRHRERLPADLRSGLSNQGLVNYPEAQAVVQTLGNLIKEMRLRRLGAEHGPSGSQPTVAILALYRGQAELIRRLIQHDPLLAGLDDQVQVAVPAAFRHREADMVLLSLTRSHTHRAVTFGEGPQMFALAMTRARSQLIVFGDPGTLVRRSQWEGPLDHLNEEAALRERQLITRLVHCLQGCGSDRHAPHLRQGSGT